MHLQLFLFIILFLVGLYFYARTSDAAYVEAFTDSMDDTNTQRCPNLLIQKGGDFFLYNSKLAKVPGVNPIQFNNLEEYVEFLSWQQSRGIKCPVLYLQHSFNAQGEACYKIRPGVTQPQGGLPPCPGKRPKPTFMLDATQNDQPSNIINAYPGFDPANQTIGNSAPLDVINDNQTQTTTANSMTNNWKDVNFTKEKIKSGLYEDHEVGMKTTVN